MEAFPVYSPRGLQLGLFLRECEKFATDPDDTGFHSPLLSMVAQPMWKAWKAYKKKSYNRALAWCRAIDAEDWRLACHEWIMRRKESVKTNDDKTSGEG